MVRGRQLLKRLGLRRPLSRRANTRLGELEARLARIETAIESSTKRSARIAGQVGYLARASLPPNLRPTEAPYVLNLNRVRFTSQNGEDGVLLALLDLLGPPLQRFVEIGSGASGGNSGFFAGELGWQGLMVDIRAEAMERCEAQYGHNQRVRFVVAEVTPANINALVRESGLDGEVDYFSLDIDSFDYWVLEALEACNPRILVLEYNAYLGPTASITIPSDADLGLAPKGYFGASLEAMTRLAATKGYRLLCCEETGVNAVLLRNDLVPSLPSVPVSTAFRSIKQAWRHANEGSVRDIDPVLSRIRDSGLPFVEV